ncbi:unnamed protein product [Ectocarpus fasciculatus]
MCDSAQGKLIVQGAHPNGAIACYSELATMMNDFLDIMNGVFGAHPEDLKRGKNKKDGYITGADSPHLDRLLEILEFFDVWQISLQASFEQGEWQKHFITDQSWFDMRASRWHGIFSRTRISSRK